MCRVASLTRDGMAPTAVCLLLLWSGEKIKANMVTLSVALRRKVSERKASERKASKYTHLRSPVACLSEAVKTNIPKQEYMRYWCNRSENVNAKSVSQKSVGCRTCHCVS